MFVIGLTGGIGSGKTEVSKVLKELGAEIIDADEAGHLAYRRGTDGWRAVVEAFGAQVLNPGGDVDRTKLGKIVFEDHRALEQLNDIVHPRIRSMINDRLTELEKRGTDVAVVEAALLLETNWYPMVDEIWVTDAAEDQVEERLTSLRGLDPEAGRARVRAQMPRADRLARAHAVIDNSSSLDELRPRVVDVWQSRVVRRLKKSRS